MTEKENRDVPTIRFDGFEADWNSVVMSKIGQPYTGLTGKTKADFGHGRGRYVTYMGVFSNPISNSSMTDPTPIDRSQNEVKKGDIFFTISSETPSEVGMSSVWMDDLENVYLNSFCFGFRPAPYLCSEFLAYMFRADEFRKKIVVLAQGISRYNISKTKALDIPVSVPECNEQQKIGAYFRGLDSLLSMHQRKHDKLVTLKKAMLQKMFPQPGATTPEIRFKGFSGEWGQKALSKLANKVTEKNLLKNHSETFTNSAEFGIISQRDYFDKDISNVENIGGYYVVESENFVYNPRISLFAPVGPVNRNKLGRTGVMSPLYTVLRTKGVDNTFLEYFFKTNLWHPFMFLNGDTGARSDRFSIKDAVFMELPVPYPDMKEQKKIGSYFRTLDALITQHAIQLQKLQQLKSAFLEKMFV